VIGLMDLHDPIPSNTILDYGRIVYRHRWMIVCLVVVSVVATGTLGKLSTKRYEAKVSLFPAKEAVSGGGSGGGISFGDKEKDGGSTSMVMEAMGGSKSGPSVMEILHAILVSRRMGEAIVNELNLMQYYGAPTGASAVNILRGEVDVRPSPYKTLELTVLTRDPQMAADIANAYAANLDRLNKELNLTAATRNRLFIEARIEEKKKKLAEAEEALKRLQTENRTLTITDQARAAMEVAGELHGRIVALEVELAALREFATPNHPMINQVRAQITELRRQLDTMEEQQAYEVAPKRTRAPMSKKIFPEFEKAPTLALDLLRLIRQVKVEEAVYGMLVGMLEQAKIAEARDVPTIQVLDPAVVPAVHSRPMTLQNVQVAGALSLILGILLAFFLNYLKQLKAQEAASEAKENGASDFLLDSNGNGDKLEAYPISPEEAERLHGPA